MDNFTEILSIIRPNQKYVIEAPGGYENLKWHPSNDTSKPTEAECLAVSDQAAELAATKRAANQMIFLRRRRNQLLAETDYLALADSTLTDEMRNYRQALRDLPANTVDPANPVWPTKP